MLTRRLCCSLTDERPGRLGFPLPTLEPKSTVTMLLPPATDTPGTAGVPAVALPAPPGPGVGEMPAFAAGSEPISVPALPPPEPAPFAPPAIMPLPGPSPRTMPEPPPEPPRPGFSPPAGDMAMEPGRAFAGSPTFGPGSFETTTPESAPLPEERGGATTAPASRGAPSPGPLLPRPEPVSPSALPRDGGGGTTLRASAVLARPDSWFARGPPAPETVGGGSTTAGEGAGFATEERPPGKVDPATEGGGGTTPAPIAIRFIPALAPEEPTAGGGGTTWAVSEPPAVRDKLLSAIVGGGATTAGLPKTRSSKLPINDVLAAGVGGGATTVFATSGTLPPASRCVS